MAPRTRQSQTIETADNCDNQIPLDTSTNRDNTLNQRGGRIHQTANTSQANVNTKGGRKRTTSSSVSATAKLAAQTTSEIPPTKKARNAGPPRARPLQLKLVSGDMEDMASQPPQSGVSAAAAAVAKGSTNNRPNNRQPLRRSYAFYAGESNHIFPPNCHPHRDQSAPPLSPPSDSENEAKSASDAETEPELDNDQEIIELAQRQPSKFQEVLQLERPSFHKPVNAPSSAPVTTLPGGVAVNDASLQRSGSAPASASTVETSKTWPPETDLVISSRNKVNLNSQAPAIRTLLHDAIERVRASLLFDNAFPDTDAGLTIIRDCLLAAAERYRPGTSAILERLKCDHKYLSKMISVPRARIALIRGEVKDHCVALVAPFFLAMNEQPDQIMAVVAKQLNDYHYIYPRAPNTTNLVLHKHPYRNDRIINTLRSLYFGGGPKSFAAQFDHDFPTFEERDGTISCEVPAPMLALVATALYVAIYEWRLGVHKTTHFTGDAYVDIYRGNYDTIKGIEKGRNGAYHRMMSDIYALASGAPPANPVPSTVLTATIDLDALDE